MSERLCDGCRAGLGAEVAEVIREVATERILRGGVVTQELSDALRPVRRAWLDALTETAQAAAVAELRRLRSDLGGGGGAAA